VTLGLVLPHWQVINFTLSGHFFVVSVPSIESFSPSDVAHFGLNPPPSFFLPPKGIQNYTLVSGVFALEILVVVVSFVLIPKIAGPPPGPSGFRRWLLLQKTEGDVFDDGQRSTAHPVVCPIFPEAGPYF